MATQTPVQVIPSQDRLSPWWRRSVFAVMVVGFSVLIFLTIKVHHEAPPIPDKVVDSRGTRLFGKEDIQAGQQVFLKYGLMDNGSIWGHGGYLGTDFSARYLHNLASDVAETFAEQRYGHPLSELAKEERVTVEALTRSELKHNRFDPITGILTFSDGEAHSYYRQIGWWADYFSEPIGNGGLPAQFLKPGKELEELTAFFAWTAWASVTNRPGEAQSYTNNFPYDPLAGNLPTSSAILWSAISLIALLVGIALVLLAFGKFDYLGWKSSDAQISTKLLPGNPTPSQRAIMKFFVVVALLFLAQTLIGGATAHYRAEPESFYGIDLPPFLPSNILRTWHLQLAIFWIATAYVAGALLLAADLGGREPKRQATLINILFVGLVTLVVGSLFPGGVLQLIDVLEKGYWHARSLPYTGQATARLIEWLRTPGDLVFIFVGVVPALIAVTLSYFGTRVDSMDFGVSAVGRREVDEK